MQHQSPFKIFVDADSCPIDARNLVLRRCDKLHIKAIFVANRRIPGIDEVAMEICSAQENAADDRIAELATKGDIVITRDIPLAQRLVIKGITVINDRGRVYTQENTGELLSLRNFTVGLAENGIPVERKGSYGKKDLKKFADSLDRLLTRERGAASSQ